MVKGAYVIIGSMMISMASFGAATALDCQSSTAFEANLNELAKVTDKVVEPECKKPTIDDFKSVCNAIKHDDPGTNPKIEGPKYHEKLWLLACADPKKDSQEKAKQKIQKMWEANKTEFRCWGYTGVTVGDGSVLKFSMDIGFSDFVKDVVETYALDLNFEDKKDGFTILDFVKKRIGDFKNDKDTEKVEEFEEIYKFLTAKGAKHTHKYLELEKKK